VTALVSGYRFVIASFALGILLGFIGYARLGPSAVSLDPAVQSALLLLVSVTIAATVGAAGAIAGSSIAAGATERMANRTREAEDRHRFTNIKQQLYVELWLECDRHRRQVADRIEWLREKKLEIEGVRPDIDSTEAARRSLKSLELIARAETATATPITGPSAPRPVVQSSRSRQAPSMARSSTCRSTTRPTVGIPS
jgi:hypothetical protein